MGFREVKAKAGFASALPPAWSTEAGSSSWEISQAMPPRPPWWDDLAKEKPDTDPMAHRAPPGYAIHLKSLYGFGLERIPTAVTQKKAANHRGRADGEADPEGMEGTVGLHRCHSLPRKCDVIVVIIRQFLLAMSTWSRQKQDNLTWKPLAGWGCF